MTILKTKRQVIAIQEYIYQQLKMSIQRLRKAKIDLSLSVFRKGCDELQQNAGFIHNTLNMLFGFKYYVEIGNKR